ncbi:MAG: TetR/AcrR family transcriptional regulator, partial [Caldimonas sp.]
GLFRGGIDPVQLYISIAGLAYFYLSNSQTLSTIFGRDLLSAKARTERLSHITEVVMGYVLLD